MRCGENGDHILVPQEVMGQCIMLDIMGSWPVGMGKIEPGEEKGSPCIET